MKLELIETEEPPKKAPPKKAPPKKAPPKKPEAEKAKKPKSSPKEGSSAGKGSKKRKADGALVASAGLMAKFLKNKKRKSE